MTKATTAKKAMSVRVGTVTMKVTAEEKKAQVFYDRLLALCDRLLPDCGCQVVLLPERAEVRPGEKQPIDGAVCRRFKRLAAEHGLYLIAPLAETRDGRLYNTQVAISPAGEVAAAYSKVHLAPGEEKSTEAGAEFGVFELPWFTGGIMTCFDNHFPESARCLAAAGAEVVFWPAYGDPKQPGRSETRCLDNNIYLIGSGIVDMSCGLPAEAFSRGLIVNPGGNVLAEAAPEDGLISAGLPLDDKTGRLAAYPARHTYLARRVPAAYGPLVTAVGP